MELGMWPWLIGFGAALIAGLAKTGVPGIGILAVPLMAMVFPAKQSVGALLPMLIVADIFAVAYYRRSAQWNRLLELFPCVLAGVGMGAVFLYYVNSDQLKPFLGGLILVLLAVELARKKFGWNNVPHQRWFMILMGSLAGFATTVGNVAGPIMNIYLISKGLEKENFMGTIAWYFFIFNCLKVPVYIVLGVFSPEPLISRETLLFDLTMLPLIVAGALLGRWVMHRISPRQFKGMVLILAALAAVRLLF